MAAPGMIFCMVEQGAIGVQFSMPIFSGGATSAKVAEAVAIHYKTRANLEAARRQAGADARQAYAGIANGLAQIEALDSAVESGKNAVKGNQVGYKLGIRINIDVLNAEQQLYTSQRDLTKARYDTLFQGLKLKAAAGVLGEADLGVINGLLVRRTMDAHRGQNAPAQDNLNIIDKAGSQAKASAATQEIAAATAANAQKGEQDNIRSALLSTFGGWQSAWAARDIEAYLGYYESGFRGNLPERKAWENNRRKIIAGSTGPIELAFQDVDLVIRDEEATVSAKQSHRSSSFSDTGIKELKFRRTNGKWLISQETFIPTQK